VHLAITSLFRPR